MNKIATLLLLTLTLNSCEQCNNKPVSTNNYASNSSYNGNHSEEEEYALIENADKQLKDSINSSGYKTDESGISEGMPDEYEAKNNAEKNLLASIEKYYTAGINKEVAKAKKYICPKVIELTKEKFPNATEQEIDEAITAGITSFSEAQEVFKSRFEGFKKTIPIVSKLNRLPSREGCLIYSVHYSIVIISTLDNENYYAWHIPSFLYAASSDNGKKWYFIELVEDTNELLNEFR